MKKILLTILCLLWAITLFAQTNPTEIWSTTQTKDCFSVSCSSSTATQVLDANNSRVAWSITNPHATNTVYISTYAVTAATAVTTGGAYHRIPANSTYTEDINPYLGVIYILTPSGETAIVVSGEERIR